MRDKQRSNRLFRNNTELGRNLAEAKTNENAYKTSGYMSLGGATAPPLVQLGSTGSGTQTKAPIDTIAQGANIFGSLAGA